MPHKDPEAKRAYNRAWKLKRHPEVCKLCGAPRPKRKYFCEPCRQKQHKLAQQGARRRLQAKRKLEGRCHMCGQLNDRVPRTLCTACQAHKEVYGKRKLRSLKIETFEAYGGCFCACCHEAELDFLGLDHINNDGYKDTRSGHQLYGWLKKHGFPPGFRVLCHNCNLGRHLNGGICPHLKNSTDSL